LNTADSNIKYLLNQNSAEGKRIIKCGTSCVVDVGKEGFYLDGSKEDSTPDTDGSILYSGLIQCSATSSEACVTVDTPSGFYVDATSIDVDADGNITYKNIISCDSTSHKCKSKTPTSGYYVNALVDTNDKLADALIECSGSPVKCKTITPEATETSLLYVENSDTPQLIHCSAHDGCVSKAITNAYFYKATNGDERFFINSGFNSNATNKKYLIKCDESACTEIIPSAGSVYLNGNLIKTTDNDYGVNDQLIICDSTGCQQKQIDFSAESDQTNVNYYVNTGKYTDSDSKDYPLIKCSYNSSGKTTDCVASEAATGIYVNGNYGEDGTDTENYLIKCTSTSECSTYASEPFKNSKVTEDTVEYYINNDATALTNAVIEVTFEPIKETGKRKRKEEKTKYEAGVSVINAGAGYVYINSLDNTLIQCKTDCKTASTIRLGTASTYYVNGSPDTEEETYTNSIIQCENTCKTINGIENGVYINGNFKDSLNTNGEENNRLIICSESKCKTVNDNGSSKITYFVNAAATKTDYSDALITCPTTLTAACTLDTTSNVKVNNVYLNGNFKDPTATGTVVFTDTENYLIICTEGKCQLETGISESSDSNDYYINAGYDSSAPLTNSLIECTSEKCAVKDLTSITTELFYINANFISGKDTEKYVIKCQKTTPGCTLEKSSSPKVTDIEHYVHGASTGFSDAVIEVTYTENKSEGSKRATSLKTAIGFAKEVKDGDIFINTATAQSLIQCSKDDSATPKESCAAISVTTGTADIPLYYVNAAVKTNNDYANLLIKCDNTKCAEENAVKDGIYLNSNLYGSSNLKGTKDVPLIICSETGCEQANSNLEKDGDEYFINSGKNGSSSNSKKLIKCTKSGTTITCTATQVTLKTAAPKDVFYINGNYGKDGNYLIQCTEVAKCELYVSKEFKEYKVTTTTKEYYVHGAASANRANAIIEVSFSDDSKRSLTAAPSIIAAPVAETVYINSATGKLIQCTSSSCDAYVGAGEEKKPYYYMNAAVSEADDDYTDAIIKCNGTKCELQAGEANGIYLNGNLKDSKVNKNSNDTNHLIVCSEGLCTGKASGLTAKGYEFFINAGDYNDGTVDYPLIKCTYNTAATCVADKITMGSATELFYINGNYDKDATKKRDTVNYLIQCTSATECKVYKSSAKEAGKEHFVHGAANKLTDAVIECTLTAAAAAKREDPVAKSFTAECTVIASVVEKNIYINGAKNTQIIRCSKDGCQAADTSPTDKKSEYFMNSVDTTAKSLIQCSKDDGCQVESDVSKDAPKVFINADFGANRDSVNQLINCLKGGACTPSKSLATEVPEFYVNGDITNEENLKGDLIKCIKGENGVTCTEETASNDNVYLNANFDATNNKKQIIACKAKDEDPEDDVNEGGCIEKEVTAGTKNLKYFVNAGSVSKNLKDTLIKCDDSSTACKLLETAKDKEIYINANNDNLIHCSEEKGCESRASQATKENNEFFLNASDLNNESDKLTNDLIKCKLDETTNKKVCISFTGKPDFVYIDSYTKGNIIYCTSSNGCKSKATFTEEEKDVLPKFYVNGDDIDFDQSGNDKDPLNGDLIKCTKSDTSINCTIVKGDKDYVFLNSNYSKDDGDTNNQLIICTEGKGCLASSCGTSSAPTVNTREDPQVDNPVTSSEKFLKYYVNSGNPNKLDKGIIKCTSTDEACTLHTAKSFEVYKNANENETAKPIIKCGSNNCKTFETSASENNNEYFKNAGNDGETPLEYDIIECSKIGESDASCIEVEKANEGVYLNSNYIETGDNEQLIQCSSDNGCIGLRSESKDGEYFVNSEALTNTNAIIFCINKKCEKQTPNSIPSFYVGYMKDEVDGLIKCMDKDKACEFKPAFTSQGYYINDGYNKAQNQTILCDSSDGCASLKVDLGYYVNEGEPSKPIIKCEKEGTECIADISPSCPEVKDAKPGNYCYDDGQLKFFPENNSTSIYASKSEDVYTFATIPDNGFPGIKRETGSLFKISRYYINRFYQSGVVMIDKNGKLVDNLSSDQSDISLYDCNDNTKVCTEKPGCTSNTYMYDSENKKAIFCNNGKLEYADIQGYVVDSNRVIGSNHPYIINCENGKCKSDRPKSTSYYENSGYDSTTNALIQCSNNNCYTVTAEVGYYVGHGGAGIIQCTSTTSCTFNAIKSKVKYVNAGSNKSSNAIIDCSKNGCSSVKAKIGYYMTYSSNLLIQCTSPSSCVEFTPTVNYYDNADSSEGSNTIINCVQSSQVITCAPEQTNNGFYMSSSPNVLIRCKSGSKCKTVTVKNGIFRGALKGLTGGSKRSDEAIELEDDNSMGMSVAMPRDADDAYGIIRCVAGKCTALTASEIASIPVCEFNNNKCYITLEYAMTKSATTSITAGNICTNADRSVFYFATDTIVVKPNVISGVTATYVYTTTNSNCLEVNDSYTDMYFTVGSNIFLLDQGSVLQFYETGYYFINTAKNTLVNGNEIDAYNDENVKLYKCNGSSCSITDKPDSLTYYADINKRILKYNVNSDSYSFAYSKDITCIFANNKCTPNADLKNQEFCITYKGELVLAKQDIKNRETGECYKAASITNNIYGYSQYLYNMNIYSAQMVDETGYYIVNLSTNTTVVSKNYKTKNNNLVVYGCQLSSCKEYIPDENTYYYDARAKTILRYNNGIWTTPSTSGYAYISLDPTNTYIYRFTKKLDEVTINAMANYGYYYTVDGEMYHCNQDEDGNCVPISNNGHYFTNAGEVYYCVHDSEELEPTECTKQACVSGQYYYIDDAYYRCESSSTLVPVMSRYCSYNENVIINFPLALTEEYPDKIKQAIEGIEKNNNSTAIVTRRGKNYLESVSGIFTNCTYNVEETKSTFDLVCVNNYVAVDEETDDIKICSMEQLGYVECIEDEENPEKCNVSWAFPTVLRPSIFIIVISTLIVTLFQRI